MTNLTSFFFWYIRLEFGSFIFKSLTIKILKDNQQKSLNWAHSSSNRKLSIYILRTVAIPQLICSISKSRHFQLPFSIPSISLGIFVHFSTIPMWISVWNYTAHISNYKRLFFLFFSLALACTVIIANYTNYRINNTIQLWLSLITSKHRHTDTHFSYLVKMVQTNFVIL